jgi:hypothetical protein
MKPDEDGYYNNDFCGKGRCVNSSTLIYLGIPLCDKHWLMLCKKEEEKEREKGNNNG